MVKNFKKHVKISMDLTKSLAEKVRNTYFTEVNKWIIIMIRTYVKCLLYQKRLKFYEKIAK